MGVALGHDKAVLFPFEIVSFIEHRLPASGEVAFSLDIDVRFPLVDPAKSCRQLLIGVHINNQREPKAFDLLQGKSVEVGGRLQIVVGCPIVFPPKADPELQLDGVVVFFDGNNLVQGQ